MLCFTWKQVLVSNILWMIVDAIILFCKTGVKKKEFFAKHRNHCVSLLKNKNSYYGMNY